MITIAIQYGIDFKDKDDNVISEFIATDEASRDELHDALANDDNHPAWPSDKAVHITAWSRKVQRQPISGVDYGPGSVKRRFGNGRCPRGTYQFR